MDAKIIKIPRTDFYNAPEEVRTEAILDYFYRGGQGVMIFDKGSDIIVIPLCRFQ